MKSRIRSSSTRSSSSSFYGYYLKPGALAQLRNSKITAKSKAKEGQIQTQILLYQLKPTSDSELALAQHNNYNMDMEDFPSFALRFKSGRPHCLHRKKLVAVTPIFSDDS